MATVSIAVPDELKKKMAEWDDTNWSAVARKAFEQRIKDFEFMKALVNRSKLTEADAKELGEKIKKGMAKRFREKVEGHR